MIIIQSKRRKPENILKEYPDAIIADVTSHAKDVLLKLSPFYPHGGYLCRLVMALLQCVWKRYGKD